jgi:erythromycin esterase-like protein
MLNSKKQVTPVSFRTGRPIKPAWSWSKWFFSFSGTVALSCFLIQGIFKAGPTTDLCQRAAYPLVISLILWLTGMFGVTVIFRNLIRRFFKSSYLAATLSILVFSVATCCSLQLMPQKVAAQTIESEEELQRVIAYLQANHEKLNLSAVNYQRLNLLDNMVASYDIMLCGESHATTINYQLRLYLIKYLNTYHGVKYYLDEAGYAEAKLINRFLETGAEDNLKAVFEELKGTAAGNKEHYQFWKDLYQYNQTKPSSERVQVVGIDIEHQRSLGVQYLKSIIPENEAPETLSIINDFKKSDNDDMAIIEKLDASIGLYQQDYRNYFKANFEDFQFVIKNIVASINCYKNSNYATFAKLRETYMKENFRFVYNRLPKGKYFGMFGKDHTYLNDYIIMDCLATYLNHTFSPTMNRVACISLLYDDSQSWDWTNNISAIIFEPFEMDFFFQIFQSNLVLINLGGKNSPFCEKSYFVDDNQGLTSVDYFQYAIYVKNSRATHPY